MRQMNNKQVEQLVAGANATTETLKELDLDIAYESLPKHLRTMEAYRAIQYLKYEYTDPRLGEIEKSLGTMLQAVIDSPPYQLPPVEAKLV